MQEYLKMSKYAPIIAKYCMREFHSKNAFTTLHIFDVPSYNILYICNLLAIKFKYCSQNLIIA